MLESRHDSPRVQDAAAAIACEQRRKSFDAIRCLWRMGDAVRTLRQQAGDQSWRRSLAQCAAAVGMHPASLEDALRAADAFRAADRERFLARFERTGRMLTPSHVIELARTPPSRRRIGIDRLLSAPHSVRELRACLREDHCDGHRKCHERVRFDGQL